MDQSIIPDTERVAYRQARNMLSRTHGMRTQSFEQAERMSLIPSPSGRGVRGERVHTQERRFLPRILPQRVL